MSVSTWQAPHIHSRKESKTLTSLKYVQELELGANGRGLGPAQKEEKRQSLLALANERIRKGNEMIRWQALAIEQRSRVKRGSIIKDKEALLNGLPGNQQERKAEAARILNTKAQEHKLISEQVAAVETSLEETFGRQTKLMIKAARQMGPNLDALRAVIVNLEVRISQLEEAIQTAQEESAGYERTIQSLREAISALETKPTPVDTV